jgi:hypothetical protein
LQQLLELLIQAVVAAVLVAHRTLDCLVQAGRAL